MPFVDPTVAFVVVGALAVVLGVLWPGHSRRWGTERTMPPDPVWEPWAYLEREPEVVRIPVREVPPASYRVGEIIETHAPRPQLGDGHR
jgi:hypothetical protein